jgi:hypothetical protein
VDCHWEVGTWPSCSKRFTQARSCWRIS